MAAASRVARAASYGCVRMTDEDSVLLAQSVAPGAPVSFVGQRPMKSPLAVASFAERR